MNCASCNKQRVVLEEGEVRATLTAGQERLKIRPCRIAYTAYYIMIQNPQVEGVPAVAGTCGIFLLLYLL